MNPTLKILLLLSLDKCSGRIALAAQKPFARHKNERTGDMVEEMKKGMIRSMAMESISERLSSLENLYFPRALQSSALNPSHRKSILLDLLSRDVPVFLERYGSQLTFEELQEFEALKDDYEVNWHITHIRRRKSPTSKELRSKLVMVKNRRRAFMDKLICEGIYFSEDAMREREPYLHHEYVGKFQDPTGRSMARPGERWSETLLRRAEEALLVAKIRGEQQRLGVAERDWVGNSEGEWEEEEEEEEEEDEVEGSGAAQSSEVLPADHPSVSDSARSTSTLASAEVTAISAAEMQDRMDQFTQIMQHKFLSGEDHDHLDYSKIDEDETLDDHWLREVNHDAEEKYFAED